MESQETTVIFILQTGCCSSRDVINTVKSSAHCSLSGSTGSTVEKHVKTASHMDPKQDRQVVSSKAKYRRAEV